MTDKPPIHAGMSREEYERAVSQKDKAMSSEGVDVGKLREVGASEGLTPAGHILCAALTGILANPGFKVADWPVTQALGLALEVADEYRRRFPAPTLTPAGASDE